MIVIDDSADSDQRAALQKLLSGQAGEPGSNHFPVFSSMCSEVLETEYRSIEIEVDIAARTAVLKVPGLIESTGEPPINAFNGDPLHIAIARPVGSFEYTYCPCLLLWRWLYRYLDPVQRRRDPHAMEAAVGGIVVTDDGKQQCWTGRCAADSRRYLSIHSPQRYLSQALSVSDHVPGGKLQKG